MFQRTATNGGNTKSGTQKHLLRQPCAKKLAVILSASEILSNECAVAVALRQCWKGCGGLSPCHHEWRRGTPFHNDRFLLHAMVQLGNPWVGENFVEVLIEVWRHLAFIQLQELPRWLDCINYDLLSSETFSARTMTVQNP